MKRSRAPSFANPYLMWSSLAWKTGEMMLASAQVVHHRVGRMAAAGATPSARDRREFALMRQEKGEAGLASAWAMAAQMMTINPWLGALAATHMIKSASAIMSLAASRTTGQAMARQAKLMRAIAQSAPTTAQLSGAAARVVRHGLNPIHSRATANAKRLSKR